MKIIHALAAASACVVLALSGCCCPDANGRTFGYSDASPVGKSTSYVESSAPVYASNSGSTRASTLEGRQYDVTLRPTNGQAPVATRLTFADGRLDSTACSSVGFAKAPYAAQNTTNGTRFNAGCDSAKIGHNDWQGTVNGDRIEGTVVTTPRNGGAPVRCPFSGTAVR